MLSINQKLNGSVPKNIAIFLVSFVAVICLVKVGEAAWQEPDTNPTVENPSAPITVSDTPQQKLGKLIIIGDPYYIKDGAIHPDYGSLTSTEYLKVDSADLQVEKDLYIQRGNLLVGNNVLRVDSTADQVVINNSANYPSGSYDQTTLYIAGQGNFNSNTQTAITAENYQSSSSGIDANKEAVYVRNESSTAPAILGQSHSSQGGGGVLGKGGDTREAADETYAVEGIAGSGSGDNFSAVFGSPDGTESGIVGINNFKFIYTDSITEGRYGHTATLLNDGTVLIVGGWTSPNNKDATNSAEIYDPATDQFTSCNSMNKARADHTATLLLDGSVIIIGGRDEDGLIGAGGTNGSVEIYDPETGFTACTSDTCDLKEPRADHTASMLIQGEHNGEILVVGGQGEIGVLDSTEIYNSELGSRGEFALKDNTEVPRKNHVATRISESVDTIIFTGGEDDSGVLSSADLFEGFNMWEHIEVDSEMSVGRTGHTATLLPGIVFLGYGRVLVVGGSDGSNVLNTAEIYNPTSGPEYGAYGGFEEPITLPQYRSNHQAQRMGNDLVLIAGGIDQSAQLNQMDVYDYQESGFIDEMDYENDEELISQLGNPQFNPPVLDTPRQDHTMTLLNDNRILIVGGYNADGVIANAEITDRALEVDWSGTITNLTAEFLDGHPAEDFADPEAAMASAGLRLDQNQQSNLYLSGQGLFEGGLNVSLTESNTENALTAVNTSEAGGIGVSVQAKSAAWDQTTYAVYSRATGDQTWAAYFDGQLKIVTDKSNSGSFIQTGYLDQATSHLEAAVLANGQVLMAGGNQGSATDDAFTADAYLFDPATSQLNKLADLPQARVGHQITNYGNDILISGGYSSSYGQTTNSSLIYHPDSNDYLGYEMILNRAEHSATQLEDGRVFIAGGFNRNEAVVYTEFFDGNFVGGPAFPEDQQRGGHTANLLADGRVLLVGGKRGTDYPYLSDGLIFDPVSNQITTTSDQFDQSINHTATLLSDGRVLVVGGQYYEESLARVQLYDPNNDTVVDLPDLHVPRYGHSTQLLSDGRVLVVGGRNDQGYLTSYEIFNPNVNPSGQWQLIDDARGLNQAAAFSSLVVLADDYLLLAGGQNDQGKSNLVSVYHPYQPPLIIGDEQAPVIRELDCQFLDGFAHSDLVKADNNLLGQYHQLNKNSNNLNLAGSIWSDSYAELKSSSDPAVVSRAGSSLYSVYARGGVDTTTALQASSSDGWAGYFQIGSTAGQTKTEIAGQLNLAGDGLTFSGQAPAGSAIIKNDAASITIANSQMTEDSQVLLSLTSASGTDQLFNLQVADKQNQSFTVSTYPVISHQGISFDYLIIN